jgi:DNA-binding NarL/FixJ family response regulator
VFTAFKRLHGRDIPGTGIGLAICQRVVEGYGGRIGVESVVGEGSNLPKADGHEILAAMRATQAFADVPVVILTSSTSPRERQRLEPLQVARYLTKPPNLKEFIQLGSAVRDLLREFPS